MGGRRSGRLPFLGFGVGREDRRRHRVHGVKRWKPCFCFSIFPPGARPGGGNVEIPPFLRDFQGAVGSVEKLPLVFHASHGPGIFTASSVRYRNRGGIGHCTLHCRSSRVLAAVYWRRQTLSLIASA